MNNSNSCGCIVDWDAGDERGGIGWCAPCPACAAEMNRRAAEIEAGGYLTRERIFAAIRKRLTPRRIRTDKEPSP